MRIQVLRKSQLGSRRGMSSEPVLGVIKKNKRMSYGIKELS